MTDSTKVKLNSTSGKRVFSHMYTKKTEKSDIVGRYYS